MLASLRLDSVRGILELGDMYCVATNFAEAGRDEGVLRSVKFSDLGESPTLPENAALTKAINELSTGAQAELLALFFMGRGDGDFAEMMVHGERIANEGGAAYIAGKWRFTHDIREGLRMLGYAAFD